VQGPSSNTSATKTKKLRSSIYQNMLVRGKKKKQATE
jgi:hypothetical protein